jgi:uncharacterized membrane protein
MTWLFLDLLSGLFAAATALLAKVDVTGIDSNRSFRIAVAERGAGDPWRMAVPW